MLQAAVEEHGDMEIISHEGFPYYNPGVTVEDADDYPEDWEMPAEFFMLQVAN
jgi:hypothetical protein